MIEFIIGGARSGKSDYALSRVAALGGKPVFVATAEPGDTEMQARIARHRQRRGPDWEVRECRCQLAALATEFEAGETVLVDCLTMWLTNWLCGDNAEGWAEEQSRFLDQVQQSPANWILVSNETGLGIVPEGRLNRLFRDRAGELHQAVAKAADSVVLVLFGLPQQLK